MVFLMVAASRAARTDNMSLQSSLVYCNVLTSLSSETFFGHNTASRKGLSYRLANILE